MIKRIFNRIAAFLPFKSNTSKRSIFSGADTGRLYMSWQAQNRSGDADLWQSLGLLRARARDLERNNDYVKRGISLIVRGVLGHTGFTFMSQAVNRNNKPDTNARNTINAHVAEWSKKGNCDVTGKFSWSTISHLILRSLIRDGEIIVRMVPGYDNRYRFAVQVIEADHLDENYNESLPNGNRVKMGIEFDKWNKPIAYHLFSDHPGDKIVPGYLSVNDERIRVPAENIIHLYMPLRISQNRGFPWLHTAMTRVNMLAGYEEAELVAARTAAAKGGYFKKESSGEFIATPGLKDSDGGRLQQVEPGTFDELPAGYDFVAYDPQHPTTAFADFHKAMIRGFASGLDVNYPYLANDYSEVNFTTLRASTLDEREVYRVIQRFLDEHLTSIIFSQMLKFTIALGQGIALPLSKIDNWLSFQLLPRGYEWVKPLEDVTAKLLAIRGGLSTSTAAISETGNIINDVYTVLKEEAELRDKLKITVSELEDLPNKPDELDRILERSLELLHSQNGAE